LWWILLCCVQVLSDKGKMDIKKIPVPLYGIPIQLGISLFLASFMFSVLPLTSAILAILVGFIIWITCRKKYSLQYMYFSIISQVVIFVVCYIMAMTGLRSYIEIMF